MNSIFDGRLTIEIAVASGIESIAKRELVSLGYVPSGAEYGRIRFEGDWRDVLRANIFLRTAERVRVVLADFPAVDFDELYEGIAAVEWQNILPKNAKITVNAKSIKSELFALSSVQGVTKKSIVNRLCAHHGLTRLAESGEEYVIEVALIDNLARVTLDTSGDGLHKRGYRTLLGEAPMRETLAAAILHLSVWNPDRVLVDPFCGSGTIPIEAALIALNIAPGVRRNFAAERFSLAPKAAQSVRDEAVALEMLDRTLRISGFDINPEAIKLALRHAENAGVRNKIHLQIGDMRKLSSRYSHGVIVTNPPYGERLMNDRELKDLYRDFGKIYASLDEWSCYTITSFRGFERHFGKRADRTRKLYNAELECVLYQFLGAKPANRAYADRAQEEVQNSNDNIMHQNDSSLKLSDGESANEG